MDRQYVFKDCIGQDIYLTFDSELFSPFPEHVLIVALHQGKLLFTCHKERGWELPGGKVEQAERPIDAGRREAWEETGAILDDVYQIGEYRIEEEGRILFHKAILLANVIRMEDLPAGFETNGAIFFPIGVNTKEAGFSPFVQDEVFQRIQEFLLTQPPNRS